MQTVRFLKCPNAITLHTVSPCKLGNLYAAKASVSLLRETQEAFADYARLCYRELGAYVKMWITLNEPNDEMVSYQEGHQMLRAHALAWHAYDREFRPLQGGQVGGAASMRWRRSRRVPSNTVSLQLNDFVV